jgi:hypothetical protein
MSVSEFACVHCLLNTSREQTLPSGMAAEFVFGAPAGSVFALGGIDGASLRVLLDQVDQGPDDRRALFVQIELAPTAEAIVEHLIELLADTVHRLWPLWFTDMSFAECRSDTLGRAAARVIARQAADNVGGVFQPWAEAAVMLALNGRKPRVQGVASAIELAQLAFALSRTGLILIMEPAEMDQHSAALVDALEWIARNAPVAVVALFPKLPANEPPLDRLLYSARLIAPEPGLVEPDPTVPEIVSAVRWLAPWRGTPHPLSEIEQRIAKMLAGDLSLRRSLASTRSLRPCAGHGLASISFGQTDGLWSSSMATQTTVACAPSFKIATATMS